MTDQCVAITASGERCKIENNLSPAGRCLWHDPDRRDVAQIHRKRGGTARRKPGPKPAAVVVPEDALPAPETLSDIVQWASWTAHQVAQGRLDPKSAREINYSLTTLQRSLRERDQERQIAELEAQVEALQARVDA